MCSIPRWFEESRLYYEWKPHLQVHEIRSRGPSSPTCTENGEGRTTTYQYYVCSSATNTHRGEYHI